MIFLPVFTFLHLPSIAEALRHHLSESHQAKCDALPFRSIYVDDRCYFAVLREVSYSKAPAMCSAIFRKAKDTTDVPAHVFGTLMVNKSKFHIESRSSGAKHIICSYDNDYKCADSTALMNAGSCIVRAPEKMNFLNAKLYCEDRGMELPAPENDLDNRIVKDALVKDPAWVDKSFDRVTGYKWRQGNIFSRWSTCNYTAGYKDRLFSGSQNNLWQCGRDMGAVVDKSGYWSNGGMEYLMDVVCLKSADNPFTKRAATCDYHELKVQKLSKVIGGSCQSEHSKACYSSIRTTTRYEILGKATVDTKRGCECTAFSFKEAGFSSSCVILSSPTTETFSSPTTIYLKKTTGCVARTDLTAEFGVDQCIDEMVPSAFRGLDQWSICTQNKSDLYVVRAIDSCGVRITLDNDFANWIEKAGDMFMFRFRDDFKIFGVSGWTAAVPIVAASCVRAGSEKCPCQPIKRLIPSSIPTTPNYEATVERVPPCNHAGSWIWSNYAKQRDCTTLWFWPADGALSFVTCKAGMWILWKESAYKSYGVTHLACYG